MMLLTLFYNPMQLPWPSFLWLLLPLLLAVTVIYKTVRAGHPKQLPRQIVTLYAQMVGGLCLLGIACWLIVSFWP